ncbi:hypothetical protein C9426_04455 [Serratia sp. S1B]|nr:hypothetical protein C9426_04455 [Serratia sp. S1B]
MLLYIIIPFVLLLVVAIVLKKRGSGQQNTDSSRSKRKVESKKKARSGTTASEVTNTQNTISAEAKPKELDPDLRRQIENLIREKNFNTAEAIINQALNADHEQHSLYLLLLQIHIEQNDQFSINQLMAHLRALNLYDIIAEAENRLTEKKEPVKPDTIQHTPIQLPDEVPAATVVEPEKPTTPQVKAVDFDLLKTDLNDEAHSKPEPAHSDLSFEKLEQELQSVSTTAQETAPASKVEEHKPLEFSLEGFNKTEIDEPEPAATKPVHLSVEPRAIESKGPEHFAKKVTFGKKEDVIPEVAKTEHHEAAFQHHHETSHTTQLEHVEEVQEAPVLEFKFDLTEPAVSKEKQPEPEVEPIQQADIAFNFETVSTEAQVEPQPVVETQELVFSFDKPEIEPETVIAPAPTVEIAAEPLSITSFDTLTSNTTESTVAAVEEPAPETAKAPVDYVVQQFPELAALSETKLNLSLAEQYIRLGAFSSARALLEDSQVQYHADELDHAKYLLNQIAS